jgi:hypothetical protein
MASPSNVERVATLVAAVSLGIAITGQAVAYADPDGRTPKHSDSPIGGETSSPSVDSRIAVGPQDGKRTTSPWRTPISETGDGPKRRFRPPATVTGDQPDTESHPRGKPGDGHHDCGEEPPIPPDPDPEPETPEPETPETVPDPPSGSDYEPPQPTFKKPEVTFSAQEVTQIPQSVADLPEPPVVIPVEPVAEIPPIIAVEAPVIPVPNEIPPAPAPVEPTASPVTTLTSQVGTGAMALTAILIFLVTGVWFYGNRLASQLPVRRKHHG